MNYSEEIRYYLRVLKRRIGHFAVPLCVVGAAGTAVVMSLPSIYGASGKILVESQQIPNDLVRSTVTAFATERVQVLQQRVMTRENVLAIADKFSLFADRKNVTKTELVDLIQSRITFEMIDLESVIKRKVKKDQVTIAFSIGFEHENPTIASKVANELVTVILEDDAKARTKLAADTTDFLKQENERLTKELAKIENEISEFKLKNSAALPEKLGFNMNQLEKQQIEIQNIEREIRLAEDAKRLLVLEASIRRAQPEATVGGTKVLGADQQLQAMKDQYNERLAILSESHPQMKALRKLIAAKEAVVASQNQEIAAAEPVSPNDPNLSADARILAEKIATIDNGNAALETRKAQLIKFNEGLNEVIAETPRVSADLGSLERQRQTLQKSTDEMSAKLAQAQLGESLEEKQQAERLEVLEAPVVPTAPVRPKRAPLLAIVGGLSFLAGAASAFGSDLLSGTIKRSSDLSRRMGLRVLSTIPYIETQKEQRKSKLTKLLLALVALAVMAVALLAIHFLYAPLDVLGIRAFAFVQRLINA